jgi:amino acid adenylation domain-containing protein
MYISQIDEHFRFNVNEPASGLVGENVEQSVELLQFFSQIVTKYSSKIAIEDGNKAMTFSNLDMLSNRYANYLRESGVRAKDKIVIYSERSLEYVLSMLAVLKLGAIYIPVDARLKPVCIQRLAVWTKYDGIIYNDTVVDIDTASSFKGLIFKQSFLHSQALRCSTQFDYSELDNERSVYIISTSGSSGEPKGVEIKAKGILRIAKSSQLCDVSSIDKIAFSGSISFDSSVFEIWTSLLNAATLTIFSHEQVYCPDAFSSHMEEKEISVLMLTSSNFNNLYKFVPNSFSRLNYLLLGGEALNSGIVMNMANRNDRPKHIINAYGPTEATVIALAYEVKSSNQAISSIPIGKPIANTTAYVLDTDGYEVKPGEIGELCIGGEGVAKGYLNASPTDDNNFSMLAIPRGGKIERVYKTGDLVQQLPEGNLDYIGRRDQQIKIRGFRVELGNIEAHIQRYQCVLQTAVVAHESSFTGKYLVGYLTHQHGRKLDINQLRKYLSKQIGDYAIPSFFIVLDKMPLTDSGKVDKKALLAMHNNNTERLKNASIDASETTQAVRPRSHQESVVANIFAKLLELETVYIHDDFFKIGGNSLLVLRLLAELEEQFNIEWNLGDFYDCCTVENIARKLSLPVTSPSTKLEHIVLLKQGSSRNKPVFMVHPIGGTTFCYKSLVDEMGDYRTIYGIQDPAVDNKDAHYPNLKALACDYVVRIQAIQPYGPYYLCGASLGATVAVEMAAQLEAKGEVVKFIGLMDGFASYQRVLKGFETNTMCYQKALHELIPCSVGPESPYYALMLERAEMLLNHERLEVKAPLTLFKASTLLPKFASLALDNYGWEGVSTGGLKVYEIDGDHTSILMSPNVARLAKCLESNLRRVELLTIAA